MNTAWENPSGHRAISYEENLSFTLSDFYQENISFLYGKSFANSLLFFRYFPPLFYHSAVHILSVLYRILLLFGRSGDGVVV